MINLTTKEISLFRQDTFGVAFETVVNGVVYALQAGEKITFTVKKDTNPSSEVLFEQTTDVVGATQIDIIIDKATQDKLPKGDYLYDVRYNFNTMGIRTGISPTKLMVMPVVGDV